MRIVRPGGATSTAASIPTGTFSTAATSSTTGMRVVSRLTTSTASSPCRTAATTRTPRTTARSTRTATSSKSAPGPTTTITGRSASTPSRSASATVTPTPRPSPPGVSGLCPIIVDSVMTVSVIVSIARPLMTGVASLSSTVSRSSTDRCAASKADRTAATAPAALAGVPFTPVVRVSDEASRSIVPPGPTSARQASVVELPTSTPTTSPISCPSPSRRW